MTKIIYVLRTSFPIYCSCLDYRPSWQLPASSISRTCPPSNVSISTNELTQSSPSSPKKHLRNQQNKLCYNNLDPESLYPWRPDHTYLLEFPRLRS
ncbi:hypothetical protein CRENBAI_003813 [Crenichthys baileyi]|uniref:Uncharacterized protein n=1 Tax=Crenichthys baileyi TaxID=28760 RepID=A0AAV9S867_9TELE